MNRKINLFGILSNGFLLAALIIASLHKPNYAILILLGILTMVFIEIPLTIVYLKRTHSTKRSYNTFTFLAFALFILSTFFFLQNLLFPFPVSGILMLLTGGFIIYFIINELKKNRFQLSKISFIHHYILFVILLLINLPFQEQLPDRSFRPEIASPKYAAQKGPVIYFDEGHNDLHTLNDRLFSTGRLLEDDGYVIKPLKDKNITTAALNNCRILVIPNALNEKNVNNWSNPVYPAFAPDEIEQIKNWVSDGGSLFLIVDHMPMPGAVANLASEFGFELKNGHAKARPKRKNIFHRANNSLSDNVITNGESKKDSVDFIVGFDGSAFIIPEDATSILTFDSTYYQWEPETAWDLKSVEPYSIKDYSMGAFKQFGKGKVVVFSEAMMFTAQLGGGLSWMKVGMNSSSCPNNYKLFLNIIHWLDSEDTDAETTSNLD